MHKILDENSKKIFLKMIFHVVLVLSFSRKTSECCLYKKILQGACLARRDFYLNRHDDPYAIFKYEWDLETTVLRLVGDQYPTNSKKFKKKHLLRKAIFAITPEKEAIDFSEWIRTKSKGAIPLGGHGDIPLIIIEYPRELRFLFLPKDLSNFQSKKDIYRLDFLLENVMDLQWLSRGIEDAIKQYQRYLTALVSMDKEIKLQLFSLTETKEDLNMILKDWDKEKDDDLMKKYLEVFERMQSNKRRMIFLESTGILTLKTSTLSSIEKLVMLLSKNGNVYKQLFKGTVVLEQELANLVGIYHLLRYFWLISRFYIEEFDVREALRSCIAEFVEQAGLYCLRRGDAMSHQNSNVNEQSSLSKTSFPLVKNWMKL
jgi:hypothetical protein